jgi:4-hydroxy-2-oxoheptanedioate aldolase
MRHSKIAAKLRDGGHIALTTLGHFIPRYVADAAYAGYDGIWLDLEHRTLSPLQVQYLLLAGHHYDIDILVRPATRERAALYRYLEDGAAGLILPHISDADTARAIRDAVKFPPLGDRGIEAQSLETNFGHDLSGDLSALTVHANRETVLCLQIETPAGLDDVEPIITQAGVDMVFVGPADLGIRLADQPADTRPEWSQVYATVNAVATRLGLPWGSMPKTAAELRQFAAWGARIHVWGRDHQLLRNGLATHHAALQAVLGDVAG